MARKNLKHQIIAGLSTTLLLGMLVVNPVFSREEANTSTQPTTTYFTARNCNGEGERWSSDFKR